MRKTDTREVIITHLIRETTEGNMEYPGNNRRSS